VARGFTRKHRRRISTEAISPLSTRQSRSSKQRPPRMEFELTRDLRSTDTEQPRPHRAADGAEDSGARGGLAGGVRTQPAVRPAAVQPLTSDPHQPIRDAL